MVPFPLACPPKKLVSLCYTKIQHQIWPENEIAFSDFSFKIIFDDNGDDDNGDDHNDDDDNGDDDNDDNNDDDDTFFIYNNFSIFFDSIFCHLQMLSDTYNDLLISNYYWLNQWRQPINFFWGGALGYQESCIWQQR